MILEEAKTKPTAFSEANVPRTKSLVFSNHLTDENHHSFSEAVNLSPNSFSDSIAKGI